MDEQQMIASIARTRMVTEMNRNSVKREAALRALRLVATDMGATLHGSEGAQRFVAACGL